MNSSEKENKDLPGSASAAQSSEYETAQRHPSYGLKCVVLYFSSVLWITSITLYANLADKMGLFFWAVIGLSVLFLAAVLTSQNKRFTVWVLYFAVIFLCAGTTVAVLIETKLMAVLVTFSRTCLNM